MGCQEGRGNSLQPLEKSRKAGAMSNARNQPQVIRAKVAGNDFELIERGEARLAAILDLIRNAKGSLKLLFYMFNADKCGTVVRDALTEAALRGVEVKLLIDGFGSGAPADFFASLEEGRGQICVFNPQYGRRYLIRNHQKLAIADGQLALIGGANIDDTYMTDVGEEHWRDLWLSIDGPAVHCASEYFDSLFRWTTRKGSKMRALRRLVAQDSQWRGLVQWKFSGPLSRRNSWWRSFGRDIGRAQKLDMIFAYFAPPGAMLRRIGRLARRRNGSARIITAAHSDNNATIGAARHTYSRLLRRGVGMYEYRPAKLHTKLAIVDDVVHIGSSNFDFRSLYLNLEIMLRIKDQAFADAMRGYFEREIKSSDRIDPAMHRVRANLWLRLKWALSSFLVTTMDYTVTRRLNFRSE
jgi:cardiolipin synthase